MKKVLISDKLSPAGLDILESAAEIQADSKPGLSPEELKAIIGDYEALVIRSGTTVTADLLAAATKLELVGRAGIGVDNVDLTAASKHGVIVENTPSGNAVTTAEHAIAMMFAVSRMIPQASASMKEGKWEKKKFMGRELCNKTLGVVGVGNIGKIVASRALGLKMRVLGFDPFLTKEAASKMGIELTSLDELFKHADYITVHVPLNDKTRGLINQKSFAMMKDGVFIINCARGGIVDEGALLEALNSEKVGGAALDVFVQEPPESGNALVGHPKVVCTPHLGASTDEAQVNVAIEVAQQVVDYLTKGEIRNSLNFPSLSGELAKVLQPYSQLTEAMGKILGHYAEGTPQELQLEYAGEIREYPLGSLTASALKGFLETHLAAEGQVNFVNAPFLAKERGIKVKETKVSEEQGYTNLLQFKVISEKGEHSVAGTVFGTVHPRLIRLDEFYLEAEPKGTLLMVKNQDKPGVIGSVGTTLGEKGINISRMHLGLNAKAKEALAVYSLDSEPSLDVIQALEALSHVLWVKVVNL